MDTPPVDSRRQIGAVQNPMARVVKSAVVHVVVAFFAALTLIPFVWLLCAAFKSREVFFSANFIPRGNGLFGFAWDKLTLDNFRRLFTELPFLRYMFNTFFLASTVTFLATVGSSMAGFALAKYEFRGRRAIIVLMLASMMIPGQVLLAPLYELIYRIGWIDNYLALIVPHVATVFGIFLFRQAFLGLPNDLIDAARIDGASEFYLYWAVAVPSVRPMIGAFTLVVFLGQWNTYLWPQIILQSSEKYPLAVAMANMVGIYRQEYGMVMAGTLMSVLPVMALFLVLQKEFIAGLTTAAVKG